MGAIGPPLLPPIASVRTVFFMRFSHVLALGWLACFAFGCGQGEPAAPEQASPVVPSAFDGAESTGASTDVPETSGSPTAQAAAGQKLFQDHCARCHGPSVNVSSFGTAADVFDYASINMPRGAPGSLTQSEYYSIVAFDLAANGVDLKGVTLDASNADSVSVH
jgi:hypothetical protein